MFDLGHDHMDSVSTQKWTLHIFRKAWASILGLRNNSIWSWIRLGYTALQCVQQTNYFSLKPCALRFKGLPQIRTIHDRMTSFLNKNEPPIFFQNEKCPLLVQKWSHIVMNLFNHSQKHDEYTKLLPYYCKLCTFVEIMHQQFQKSLWSYDFSLYKNELSQILLKNGASIFGSKN